MAYNTFLSSLLRPLIINLDFICDPRTIIVVFALKKILKHQNYNILSSRSNSKIPRT